jgi:hypothetical protein
MNTWLRKFSLMFGIAGALSGCGSSSKLVPAVPLDTKTLTGNWLLTGTLPAAMVLITDPAVPITDPAVTMTFDVSGSSIRAGGFASVRCDNNSRLMIEFGQGIAGTVLRDGSFTAQLPVSASGIAFSVQGSVPDMSRGPWSGSYSLSLDTPHCSGKFSGPFTAGSIQPVSGVFAGNRGLAIPDVKTGLPQQISATVKMTLQQGASRTDPLTGETAYSNAALSGSIQVEGLRCFTSGAISTKSRSEIDGNRVTLTFDMDDGSNLQIMGFLTDMNATHFSADLFLANGGTCGTIRSLGISEMTQSN